MGRDPAPYKEPEYEEGAWLYTKPYYRISQYLIGITIGYVLFRLKGRKLNINKVLNVILWCCALAAGFAIVYGTYASSQGDRPVQGVAIFYLTAYRFAFSLCIGWVIFACATGNGGPINCILSWNAWIPLARMNYCAYLTHLIILFLYTFGLEYLWYYSDFNFAIVFIGITVITYAVSFLVAMVVEIPMIGLEKVMIPSKMRKK
ncbi:nose resistant to fluoxetine protein 6-like [Ptychodera flava]|uniref:nose resistant to fluoxetine protein 6-like n=1 Tax=Ptychodera flava TaxID=63121 RepID=UPI003969FE77